MGEEVIIENTLRYSVYSSIHVEKIASINIEAPDGRFELGLGAGVSSTEFEQMGIPFASAGARVNNLEETIQLVKQLFAEETVNFRGKFYRITELKGNIRSLHNKWRTLRQCLHSWPENKRVFIYP